MATLKPSDKNSWTAVPMPINSFAEDENFQFLSQIEELTDYSMFTTKGKDRKKVKVDSQQKTASKRKVDGKADVAESKLKRKKKILVTDLSCQNSEAAASSECEIQSDEPTANSDADAAPPVISTAWSSFGLSDEILNALIDLNFAEPTPIQQQCLPHAIRDRLDILGAAETGSGKTLAFSLPIIQGLLDCASSGEKSIGIKALILTPTRELAIQIKNHINAVLKYTPFRVAVIVGGLSIQKQERLLKKKPQILVATPGRLWAMMEDGCECLKKLSEINYLVIDETDRMVEKGHFQELALILDHLSKYFKF